MKPERYENLNGMRAYAAIGIILMHVRANGRFAISGFIYDEIIASFTNLTYFFMLISAFSMCCGYYVQFKDNTISIEQFYKKRYVRIWPYFALLCTIELIINHSLSSLYEWFADLTLAFGLLPNADISVVGVGWFIGVIFVFYMVFPFYIFLIGNKKKAWSVLAISIIMNILCQVYFFDNAHVVEGFGARTNILFCSVFFVAGGLIYLYRERIKGISIKRRWVYLVVLAICIAFYYSVSASEYTMLVLFSVLVFLGICDGSIINRVFQNKVARYLGSVSMEIYLCHMFVFRAIEKVGILHFTGNEIINYGVCTICDCAEEDY